MQKKIGIRKNHMENQNIPECAEKTQFSSEGN